MKAPVRLVSSTACHSARGVALRRLADRSSGIVDEDVEPAEPSGSLVDHRPAGGLVGDVESDESAFAAERFYCRLGFLRITRRHYNAGAGRRQSARHAEPDPAIATGDDSDTPVEVE
jgi:hypothetical protein